MKATRSAGLAMATAAALAAVWLFVWTGAAQGAETRITWYGHAAFKIETPSGGVILVDPFLRNPRNPDRNAVAKLNRVDYIIVTHGHGDHVGQSVEIGKKTGALLVSSAGLRRNLTSAHGFPGKQATFATVGNTGGKIRLGKAGASVTLVNAVHGSEMTLPKSRAGDHQATSGGNALGVVIEIDGGPTIYHTGDTDVFTDMKLIDEFFDVDVMLTAIGDHFTMGPERAALALEFVRPKVAVPMHYGTFGVLTGTPEAFAAAIKARGLGTRLVVMRPGDTRSF